jgi:hypothetical protein
MCKGVLYMNFSVGSTSGFLPIQKKSGAALNQANQIPTTPKSVSFGKGSSSSSSFSDYNTTRKRKSDAEKLRDAAYSIQDPTIRQKLLEQADRNEQEASVSNDKKTLKKTAASIKDPVLKKQLMDAAAALDAKPTTKPKRTQRKPV